MICNSIEKSTGKPLRELFDLISGTSTGGILAMGYGLPSQALSTEDLVNLYKQDGPTIFANPRGLNSYIRHPKYSNANLRSILAKYFGEHRLADATVDLLITSYDMTFRSPHMMTRRSARENNERNYFMADAGLATSAAPTYFPPHLLGERVLIDGGLVANNPACLAIAEARQLWPDDDDILLVSLGTGTLAKSTKTSSAQTWGKILWATPAIEAMFDGTAKATETFLASALEPDRYFRFQCTLDDLTEKLDSVSPRAMRGLQMHARFILDNSRDRFDKLVGILRRTNSSSADDAKDDTRRLLGQINRGVRDALSVDSRAFQRGVNTKIGVLTADVKLWKRKTMRVPVEEAGKFLVSLYTEAKRNVFSTRLRRFSGIFRKTALNNEIRQAHRSAGVKTTRVFVFDSKDDVTGFDVQEMRGERADNIDVRLLIRSSIQGPIEDFAIIDDVTVGVTEFVGRDDAAGRWIFGDDTEVDHYIRLRDQLLEMSVDFDTYIQQEQRRYSLWLDQTLVEVSAENIDEYQQLSAQLFGDEAAEASVVLNVQNKAGGIYLLKRAEGAKESPVGIISIIPMSRTGYRRLERDEIKGSEFTDEDIMCQGNDSPLAYYLGSIGGVDRNSKGALLDFLKSSIREITREGAESVFARPVTEDGLRMLRGWSGPSGSEQPIMKHVCRLRL
jgi:predicted acylesterase/phospholipase RssA